MSYLLLRTQRHAQTKARTYNFKSPTPTFMAFTGVTNAQSGMASPISYPICQKIGEASPIPIPICQKIGEASPIPIPICQKIGEASPISISTLPDFFGKFPQKVGIKVGINRGQISTLPDFLA